MTVVFFSLMITLFFGTIEAQINMDIRRKERRMHQLVERAVRYMSENSLGKCCHEFTKNDEWRKGDLFVFVIRNDGTCFAFGDDVGRIWTSFSDVRDIKGRSIVERFNEGPARKGVSFAFNNLTMHAHARRVEKDNQTFFVGSAFFPVAPDYFVVNLVRRVTEYFKKHTPAEVFKEVNNPYGKFVRGESSVFIIDQTGKLYAYGSTDPLPRGKTVFSDLNSPLARVLSSQKIQDFMQSDLQETWLPPLICEIILCKTYLAKFKDQSTGKTYIVGSVYHPNTTDDDVFSLVQKAIGVIKADGAALAFKEFNKPQGEFAPGSLRITTYNMKGICLANGDDPTCIGKSASELDTEAQIRSKTSIGDLIEAVRRNGRAWLIRPDRRAFKLVYAERISTPQGDIVVSSGYWPTSTPFSLKSIMERAVDFVQRHGEVKALRQFISRDPTFFRGSYYVSAYDKDGIILSEGPNRINAIWSPFDLLDRRGSRIIDSFRELANQGGGWMRFKRYGAWYTAYVKQAEYMDKSGKSENIIISTGYFA